MKNVSIRPHLTLAFLGLFLGHSPGATGMQEKSAESTDDVSALIEKLGDAQDRVRTAASEKLVALGKKALPQMHRALKRKGKSETKVRILAVRKRIVDQIESAHFRRQKGVQVERLRGSEDRFRECRVYFASRRCTCRALHMFETALWAISERTGEVILMSAWGYFARAWARRSIEEIRTHIRPVSNLKEAAEVAKLFMPFRGAALLDARKWGREISVRIKSDRWAWYTLFDSKGRLKSRTGGAGNLNAVREWINQLADPKRTASDRERVARALLHEGGTALPLLNELMKKESARSVRTLIRKLRSQLLQQDPK